MAVTFSQNTYSGEVLDALLSYTAQGNDTYKEGLVYVKGDIQYKLVLPRISLGKIIQDNKDTPVSPTDSKGSYDFTERYLEPKDFMVYLEFNPRHFEKYWKTWQPDGNLVFRTLDPKLQAKMVQLLIEEKNTWFGSAIWQSVKGVADSTVGDTTTVAPAGGTALGTDDMKYFDGVMKRILDNMKAAKAGDTVTVAGSTTLDTGDKVEAALQTMWRKVPNQIRTKNLSIVMDWDLWNLYDQYCSTKDFKYTDNTMVNARMFKGKRIVPIVGVPAQTIVMGNFTTGMDSNIWVGMDYVNDQDVLKVEQLQANSELYFFQMRIKMDVNIVKPAEIIVWTAYTNKA